MVPHQYGTFYAEHAFFYQDDENTFLVTPPQSHPPISEISATA